MITSDSNGSKNLTKRRFGFFRKGVRGIRVCPEKSPEKSHERKKNRSEERK